MTGDGRGARSLRDERDAARDEVGRAAGRLAAARGALRAAIDPAARERLAAEHERALARLAEARAAEAAARRRLGEAVAGLGAAPVERIDGLDARHPVALLPVRLETRFRRGPVAGNPQAAGELLVRIYPDSVLADSHEPLLTAREVDAGRDYWRRAFRDRGERDAWSALLAEADSERAAWIVEQTTPTNLADLPDGVDPQFGELEVRPDNWHRAPEARGLPERWIVSAYRDGTRRHQVISGPVHEGLALTPRLSGDAEEPGVDEAVDLSGDGLEIEPALLWAYDFDEAVRAGMAVRIPLTAQDLAQGFSTVLVAGVRTGEPARAQAAELAELLAAHRYSRGLAFVAQGTPTNNTGERPSAYPPDDPAGALGFHVARGEPQAAPGSDGHRFATAFGIAPATVHHVAGAGRDEQTAAGAMADALWPATIGYALDQLLAPEVSPRTADRLRAWMRAWVRPRGPLPAFRVGAVPYGVLPVGSIRDWEPAGPEGAPARLPEVLKRLAGLATELLDRPPHVGRTDDPDRDLIELLGMDASSRTAKVRRTLGFDAVWNAFGFAGVDLDRWDTAQRRVAQALLEALAEPERDPRALYLSYAGQAPDFAGPMVADPPLSETDPLEFDYVAWLRTASPDALRSQQAPPSEQPLTALLYLMLRHALLTEYDRSGRRLLGLRQLLLANEGREPELVGILPERVLSGRRPPPIRTAWERFEVKIPDVTGERTVGEFLADPRAVRRAFAPDVQGVLHDLARYRAALRGLEGLPTAELHRLFTETIDACSHRLDTWLTSLATRRLAAMREAPEGQPAPRGVWLGCYGWVEDLHADPPGETVEVTLPDGSKEGARTDSGGYVYAPSMLHGAAAAVLRSAYLARSGPAREPYTVDLSSRRVREALALLDAVRDSQPLGAVLGYQFERGLHEGHPGVELDRFIDTFRALFPAVAGKTGDTGEPAEAVAARNVVDGLRLLQRRGSIPWGTGELPAAGPRRAAIEAELERLEGSVDALGDLLLGESVFQAVKGSTAGAAATLDTLAKGQRPPEPELVTVPRGGTVLHQRIALLLGDGSLPPPWAALPATPRSRAARELNGWLAWLLGDPGTIECRATPQGGPARNVTLADLALQPVDLLLIVQAAETGGALAELDRRVAWQVAGATGADRPLAIDYEAARPGRIPFAAAIELLAAAGRLLGFGRPLAPGDLLPPERVRAASAADPMSAELDTRATVARATLAAVRADLAAAGNPAGRRAALLRAAALGVAGAVPTSRHAADPASGEALAGLAASVAAELDRRQAEVGAAGGPGDVLRAVFGRELPVVPRFRPAAPELLGPTLAREPDLGDDPDATVEGWLAQLARVRAPLDAWRDVQLYGRALGRPLGRPRIAQLPLQTAPALARWAALAFGSEADRPRSGLVSLALLGAAPPGPAAPWAGLLLDTWPELIPSREEDAGVVFHFDAPRAEAPQVVLLAVPPAPAETWSWDHLERTLLHTLELARMRALDLSDLGRYAQLVPMTYLAANRANAAVSTSFAGMLAADAIVVTEG